MFPKGSKQVIIFLFSLAIIAVCGCWQLIDALLPECDSQEIPPRYIESADGFEVQWELTEVFVDANEYSTYLTSNNERLAIYGALGSCKSYSLIGLDVNDGAVMYDESIKVPATSRINNVVSNSQYIYFGYQGSKAVAGSTIGAGGVSAYAIETGETVWTYTIPGASLIRSLAANDNYLAVDGGTDRYYLFNSATGDVVKTLGKKIEPGMPVGTSVNFAFWYDYISVNHSSGDGYSSSILFWSDKFNNVVLSPLLLSNSLIIKRSNEVFSGMIFALDRSTGDTLWNTSDDIVSNISSNGSTLFFLTSSAQLTAVDASNGTLLGSVRFTGDSVQMIEERGFFVTASGDNVFVYLGDSHQLFAFRFSSQ